MGMFNNWDVGGGIADFWAYIREPRPHRWASWGVAIVLPVVVIWGFSKYLIPYEKPKPTIVYFENWQATRSEADIRADWVKRAKETTLRNAQKRAEYQRFADSLGIDYDSSEADKVTRETLGEDVAAAAKKKKPAPPKRSTLAERAARGPAAQTQP
ncbi:MAG: hypothetical protein IE934_11580 [Sphingopyxis sp.]|nr:hypothetical protein [Sphingopyxis sp.]